VWVLHYLLGQWVERVLFSAQRTEVARFCWCGMEVAYARAEAAS
jgi:hypothetical protein